MESKIAAYFISALNLGTKPATKGAPGLTVANNAANGDPFMQVLVLGMCRTGTTSMYDALQQLGYKPYHMAEAFKSPKRDFNLWIEAVNAKYNGIGKPWGRAEFDNIFRNCTAMLDLPSALFIDELVTSYPEAKVILTLRDPDAWITSMNNTLFYLHTWPLWSFMVPYNSSWVGPWISVFEMIWDGWLGERRRDYCSPEFSKLARQKFIEHYDHVRKVVPKERLLEFSPSMGWDPLCEFLGTETIQASYPRSNDTNFFLFVCRVLWVWGMMNVFAKTALPALVIGVAATYLYRYL